MPSSKSPTYEHQAGETDRRGGGQRIFVEQGMTVGLGTGSTVAFLLGQRREADRQVFLWTRAGNRAGAGLCNAGTIRMRWTARFRPSSSGRSGSAAGSDRLPDLRGLNALSADALAGGMWCCMKAPSAAGAPVAVRFTAPVGARADTADDSFVADARSEGISG